MKSAFFTYFIKIPGEIICPPSSTALGKIKIKTNAVKGQIYIINKAFLDEQEWGGGEDGLCSLLVPMNFVYV